MLILVHIILKIFWGGFETCFEKCVSVTFRDQYSFDLFSKYKNVAYAPDVVLNLDISSYIHLNKTKNVIISVIDFNRRRDLKKNTLSYEKFIKDCCIEVINSGNIPVLMSFCKEEGDEVAINRIYNELPNNLKPQVKRYFYRGNINETIEYIASSMYIIATRFHAMILAIRFNKPFYSVAYNQKIINVLNDLNCDAYVLPSMLDKIKIDDILDRYSKPIEANKYIEDARKQFCMFEQYLRNEIF